MDLVSQFPFNEFNSFVKNLPLESVKGLKLLYGSYNNVSSIWKYLKRLAKNELFLNCAVIGLPNVGKSTIINSLSKKKKCKASPIPGTTKNFQWVILDYNIKILDLPGVVLPQYVQEEELIKLLELEIINYSFVNLPKDKVENLQRNIQKTKSDNTISSKI
jgi:ribosome biogenesis GTPase A